MMNISHNLCMKTPKNFWSGLLVAFLFTTYLGLVSASAAGDKNMPLPPLPPKGPQKSLIALTPDGAVEAWSQEWFDSNTGFYELGHAGPIMSNVAWDVIPLSEVANQLKTFFSNQFDAIIPPSLPFPVAPGNPPAEAMNPGDIDIKLQLRKVTAGEVFNAMNLYFEAQGRPVRWELKMNGHRPTAMIVAYQAPEKAEASAPRAPLERSIIYVGDLLGVRGARMSMDQLLVNLRNVYQVAMAGALPPRIDGHIETELLIVTGTPEQLNIVRSTIEALKEKLQEDRRRTSSLQGKPTITH